MVLLWELGSLLKHCNSYFYKLDISYCGNNYFGWQKQKAAGFKTIQGTLEEKINELSNGALVNTIGSGRTDTGVHAISQMVRVEMKAPFPKEMFLKGINNLLPSDIRINEYSVADENFHPVFGAKEKTYVYAFSKNSSRPFFDRRWLTYKKEVDIELMSKGAHSFQGKHDFLNYMCVGTEVKSTVRHVKSCKIYKAQKIDLGECKIEGEFYLLEITGDGFLKQMVRLIMGSLFSLNEKKVSLLDIERSLKVSDGKKLGATAPGHGLYLQSVVY